ncbi:MAG: cytochrome c [Acidimicrobiia bacterium]
MTTPVITAGTVGAKGRFGPHLLAILALVLGLFLAGCSSDSSATSSDGVTEQGEAVYQDACASCHGTDLRGTNDGPPLLSQVYEPGHHPDIAFVSAIKNGSPAHHWGFGDMSPVPGLDDNEIDAVISYIRQQQETHGYEPYPPQ